MIQTKGLTGAQSMLRVLGKMGVERIFASPGSEWSPLWEALAEPGVEGMPIYMSTRHEEIAVGMASGYAKSTGKLPAVVIHTTVGALHATMAMRGALHEQVPMVVFAGESIGFGEDDGPDPGGQWGSHLGDMGGPAKLVDHTVKWSFGINTKSILPATIQRACRIAMAGPRGPVFLSMPMEYLFETMTKDVPSDLGAAPLATADPKGIEELADMLAGAKNPVIITEDSGRTAKGVECLVEIAELLGCPVAETRSTGAINLPRTHPLHSGFDPKEVVQGSDVIFLLAVIAPWHPASITPSPGAKVAALDENPHRAELPYYGYQIDLCLAGEVESSLEHLLAALKKRVSKDDPARRRRAEDLKTKNDARRKKWRGGSAGPCQSKADGYSLGGPRNQPGASRRCHGGGGNHYPSPSHSSLPRQSQAGIIFRRLHRWVGNGSSDRVGRQSRQSKASGGLSDRRWFVQLRSRAGGLWSGPGTQPAVSNYNV